MKELFVDTETSGLPISKDLKDWPKVVQISWIFEGKENDYIIAPTDYVIPADSTAIHGITDDYARKVGKDFSDVIRLFVEDIKKADKIIGHNVGFDINVISAHAIIALGRPYFLENIKPYTDNSKRIDTMTSTTLFCNIPGYYGPKWPKLEELYAKLFPGETFPAHNSLEDVRATKRCYEELRVKHGFRW